MDPDPRQQEDNTAAKNGRILIVDDNPVQRMQLARGLANEGHRPSTAANGRQALAAMREQPFDLVLLDIVMPEMDGYQVLEEMKGDVTLRDIPVIVISGLDEMDSVAKGIKLGAEEFLPKPFEPVLLRARISACLEKKWMRDQELEYLRQVESLTRAAAAVEAGDFDPLSLAETAERADSLGHLARVFLNMAREVYAREERLKQELHALRITIDEGTKARHVAEITETEYFRQLSEKAQTLRKGR